MPSVTVFVQRVLIDSSGTQTNSACVFVGPSPANTELMLLKRHAADPPNVGAMKASMLDALTQALGNRREVVVTFVVNDGITAVEIRA
jgi:hypothetical protein